MIVLDCGLNEELKWGQACYTFGEQNVVLMHGFREIPASDEKINESNVSGWTK
jgi:uncharacterized protein YdeI (YjbR/CyaY-like superfamily)